MASRGREWREPLLILVLSHCWAPGPSPRAATVIPLNIHC